MQAIRFIVLEIQPSLKYSKFVCTTHHLIRVIQEKCTPGTDLHRAWWNSMDFGPSLVEFHGFWWILMDFCGSPSTSMDVHESPWVSSPWMSVHIFQVSFCLLQTLPLSFQASTCSTPCLPNLKTWCRAMGALKPCSRL